MNREISKSEIASLIKYIRKEIPDVTIRTSIIVGFPGEGDREFNELLDFISEIKFDRLGVFIYSREEGTPAYNFPSQVPDIVKRRRFDIIMMRQQEIASQLNQALIGKVIEAMIERQEKNIYVARSEKDAPEVDGCVFVHSARKLKPGEIIKVKITSAYEYDLVGEEASS
jgi:ribosomal protein S12 methylthiotransferase